MGVEAAEDFLKAGGKKLRYLTALNATDSHLLALEGIIARHARQLS